MLSVQDLPIRTKLRWILGVSVTLAVLLVSLVMTVYDHQSFRARLSRELEITAEVVGSTCAAALMFEDHTVAGEILQSQRANPSVVEACLYDQPGHLFASFQRDGAQALPPPLDPGEPRTVFDATGMSVTRAVMFDGEQVGTIYMRKSLESLQARFFNVAMIQAAAMAAALLLVLSLSERLQRVITRPLGELVAVARRVSVEQDFSLRAPAYRRRRDRHPGRCLQRDARADPREDRRQGERRRRQPGQERIPGQHVARDPHAR